ncbi:hypothetical protein INP83_06125 [Mucilaginibacter sp. 21P]|uniref:hypothetical protein n=1 Tax=Mucilaginibacter sp. 21P TaxID=2778902 RepID=UPI001C571F88|nr:hypothetical protein [Mucilaginibacter sp. 21P]QXV66656.1 hypothetical protein INP83_06125 [Mucilaginibacter sp. 21P]
MKPNIILLITGLVLAGVLTLISIKTTNYNTERWTSVGAGFVTGVLLLKAPKALTQRKRQEV